MLSQSRLKAARSSAWRELSSISSITCFFSVGSERSRCAAFFIGRRERSHLSRGWKEPGRHVAGV